MDDSDYDGQSRRAHRRLKLGNMIREIKSRGLPHQHIVGLINDVISRCQVEGDAYDLAWGEIQDTFDQTMYVHWSANNW